MNHAGTSGPPTRTEPTGATICFATSYKIAAGGTNPAFAPSDRWGNGYPCEETRRERD